MASQKIIDWFRFAVRCWDWDRVQRYYDQYPGLAMRFDRELADLAAQGGENERLLAC